MHKFSPETIEALEIGRTSLFVKFDFLFLPKRVHSGQGVVVWDGQEWEGIGETLKVGSSSRMTSTSPRFAGYVPGSVSASLPLDSDIAEIISRQYYWKQKIEYAICAVDENNVVIERVHFNYGIMNGLHVEDDLVTFTAKNDYFESTTEKDTGHKRKVEAVRSRFKSDLKGQGLSWLSNFLSSLTIEFWSFIVNIFSFCFSRSTRQRWAARKQIYWFKTQPAIPRIKIKKDGYKVKADTLDEAKTELYRRVAKNIWEIPRGYISMIIYINDRPLELLDLEHVRHCDDPRHCDETSSIKSWGQCLN